MGLTNIKDLTHEMENILGKIRSREMVPNPEIVNILLMASDTLRNLVNDVFNSNEVDISEHVEALKSISEGGLSNEPAPGPADVSGPDVKSVFPKEEEDIANAQKDQKYVYLIQILMRLARLSKKGFLTDSLLLSCLPQY